MPYYPLYCSEILINTTPSHPALVSFYYYTSGWRGKGGGEREGERERGGGGGGGGLGMCSVVIRPFPNI